MDLAQSITKDPVAALKEALKRATGDDLRLFRRALSEAELAMQLSDLSVRQIQALIALRYASSSTLSQLVKVLNWDRSNTYRCLVILIKKGYVGKFYGDHGPTYFAIERHLENSAKSAVFMLIRDSVRELLANYPPKGLVSSDEMMTTMTTPTTTTIPTTATTPTIATMPPMATIPPTATIPPAAIHSAVALPVLNISQLAALAAREHW